MRNERKNAVRQTIVDTASRLFYKQGYNNTGINQIIEESGVVKSSLYTTFRSKEEILMAYLVSAGAALDEELKNSADKFDDPNEQALAVLDFLIELVQRKEYYGCNFLNIISEIPNEDERIRAQIKKQKDGVRMLFYRILEPIGKEQLSDELYLLFEGALISNKIHNHIWPVATARSMAERLLNNSK